MNIWEVGILLMGIGVLILCIFAATTIRDLGATFKRIDRMLTDHNGQIETIITNAANISTEVDGIATNVNKATDVVGMVSSFSSGISNIFKKDDSSKEFYEEKFDTSTMDSEFDDLDEMLKENYQQARKNARQNIRSRKTMTEELEDLSTLDQDKNHLKKNKHKTENLTDDLADLTKES
ncbi:MAG: DUF948 domain-containing protein [Peptostreptococcaceae bacterium]|nr:DUF948 domain-containing protein [Peptostreptococcaceae bacterium]